MKTFLELLAVFTQLVTAVLILIVMLAQFTSFGKNMLTTARATLGEVGLYFAAAVATVTMLGSLYLSEVLDYPPCKLCWYQRIGMYSTAIILIVASIRKLTGRHGLTVRPYALTLVCLGACVSLYHIALEIWPSLESATSCDPVNPCTTRWIDNDFGYLTIPRMALTAFTAIFVLLTLIPSSDTPHLSEERS